MNLPTNLIRILSLAVFCSWISVNANAQKLDEIRGEVRAVPEVVEATPTDAVPSKTAKPVDAPCKPKVASFLNSRDKCEEEVPHTNLFGNAVAAMVTSPYWFPYKVLNDDFGDVTRYQQFPYENGYEGALGVNAPLAVANQTWLTRFGTDFGTNFNDVQTLGSYWLAEHHTRFGIEGRSRYFRESTNDGTDQLVLGAMNATFRFAQNPQLAFRSGLGVNWLHDSVDTNLGVNWRYAIDWYPSRPWVASTSLDLGTLGKAFAMQGTARVGRQLRHCQCFVGAEMFRFDASFTGLMTTGIIVDF